MLSNRDKPTTFKLTLPLTQGIKNILGQYPDGSQICRELLQNSDDAKATCQWFLIDHRSHSTDNKNVSLEPSLLNHPELDGYMGPALIAGNDSIFEKKDFQSLMAISSSAKVGDVMKIGQMGIGFNSVYHMTDSPSFITGDQIVIVDPHSFVFDTGYMESFVGNDGLKHYPDKLYPFAALEDIDFSNPYQGTIFRFPLRTEEQAIRSEISNTAYSVNMVDEMLSKLEKEALECLLFLKHIERIVVYERKEENSKPVKRFEVEIVNASEVRAHRAVFLDKLKDHLDRQHLEKADHPSTLDCTVWPQFKLTRKSEVSFESWMVTNMVGDACNARNHMAQYKFDTFKLNMIPWVGIASPIQHDKNIDSQMFCFLPIGSVESKLPVHIHGHFAVKPSRREIWYDQDGDLANHAEARAKSLWNAYLFDQEIPLVYSKFLHNMGLTHGANYSLWPTYFGDSHGLQAAWKNLLQNVLKEVIANGSHVFFCRSIGEEGKQDVFPYKTIYISDNDLDEYPLIQNTIGTIVNLAVGLHPSILKSLKEVLKSADAKMNILQPSLLRNILREHKDAWNSTATQETRVELLQYCIQDGQNSDLEDLEGLPLLPLAGNLWVEFSSDNSHERFLVDHQLYKVLSISSEGLVDINVIPHGKFVGKHAYSYWSPLDASLVPRRIKDFYMQTYYKEDGIPSCCMQQPGESFPTNQWLLDFWTLVSAPRYREILNDMEGLHLLPITEDRLAPLSVDKPVLFDNTADIDTESVSLVVEILSEWLDWPLVRPDWKIPNEASEYFAKASDFDGIIRILGNIPSNSLNKLEQHHRQALCDYVAKRMHLLKLEPDNNAIKILRRLPIYREYGNSQSLVALESMVNDSKNWATAFQFSFDLYPWLPSSIDLLSHGRQPMRNYLKPILEVPNIDESRYWYHVLSELTTTYAVDECDDAADELDNIVSKFCKSYYTLDYNKYPYCHLLRHASFVRVTGPRMQTGKQSIKTKRLSPCSVVDPSLSELFRNDEIVFPQGIYCNEPVLGVIKASVGIISVFDESFILDRLKSLFSPTSQDNDKLHESVIMAFYKRLDDEFTASMMTSELQEAFKSIRWILGQKVGTIDLGLFTPDMSRPFGDARLVRSQVPISVFRFKNLELLNCMRWTSAPSLDMVLSHISSLIKDVHDEHADIDEVEFCEIYRYLQKSISDTDKLAKMRESLGSLPWILINGTLYKTDRVAFMLPGDLAPLYAQIHNLEFKELFVALGIREKVRHENFKSSIEKIGAKYSRENRLTDSDQQLVVRLLEAIAQTTSSNQLSDLLILTNEGQLRKISEVVYDDVHTHQRGPGSTSTEDEEGSTCNFTSPKVSIELANKLCISMLSQRSWNDQIDNDFEDFEQKEDLVVRIRGILNDCDPSSIFYEFLQNAADAGATKCSFALDLRTYKTNTLLRKEMGIWQGPALLIYNNAEFKEEDFAALLKLGYGNKGDDLSKIGRHGVGFNSLYHFTDLPSIVSGGYICYFDPLLQHLPTGGRNPRSGQRRKFLALNSKALEDQLSPYMSHFGCTMDEHFHGTIFRIPLRKNSMTGIGGRAWTVEDMCNLMKPWV
ncbi:hypothetical protein BGZ46_007165 [Entomortierella lignicola]|nr:hypothetical protein BGZ46_007165 [Entomortierella lignicola]